MLLRTVSLNSTVSCVTMPTCARKDESVTSRTSCPSTRIFPADDIEEARKQVDQSALSGSTGTDDGENLSSLYFKIDVTQDLAGVVAIGLIGKIHVFEADAFGEPGKRFRARLLRHDVFGVHKCEELRRRAQRLLEAVVEDGKLAYRVIHAEDCGHERNERSEGELVDVQSARGPAGARGR